MTVKAKSEIRSWPDLWPDNFALRPEWLAGFDVTPCFMSGYETVKYPGRDLAIEGVGW